MTQAASPRRERVRYLGTTWYTRGTAYWARRIAIISISVLVSVGMVALSGGVFLRLMEKAQEEPKRQAVYVSLFVLFTFFGIVEAWISFHVASAQKREHFTERDRQYWRWQRRFQLLSSQSNPGALTVVLTVVVAVLSFGFGAGMFASLGLWSVALLSQKYASPEEYAAVRRSQGLPPLDHGRLLVSAAAPPPADRAGDPAKIPLVGRSWAKRGFWYWARRGAWTVFFVWIFFFAANIAVEAVVLCGQGHWLHNRALAVFLSLLPVAWGAYTGGRALWTFHKAVREDRDLQPHEIRAVGCISERQRAVAGVGGLLVFWYFYHSPTAALMHAGSGSSRAFARFLLLFVVGILFAWAITCFGRNFGPEEYAAARAWKAAKRP